MPDPIPDSEGERTEEVLRLINEVRRLGPEAEKEWTSWELQILSELNDGRACTRIRFKEIREGAKRILKKFEK